jgi:hypothetical protein
MFRTDNRINRRTALAQMSAATMFAAAAAKAQRPDPSLAQIRTTDLGRKTYMLEGQGGNILVVVGDDGIIMVDIELAPLRDKIKAAFAENSNLRRATSGIQSTSSACLQFVQPVVNATPPALAAAPCLARWRERPRAPRASGTLRRRPA